MALERHQVEYRPARLDLPYRPPQRLRLLPAWRATRGLSGSLAQHSRTQVSARSPVQWILVGVQVALAVTLLFGAGLLLRSFQELGRVTPGFDPNHVLTMHISASWAEMHDMKAFTQRIDRILETLRAVPGVEAAATSATLPGVPDEYQTELKMPEGQEDPTKKVLADSRFVSTGYFDVMRIAVLQGETCKDIEGTHLAVVNRSFANQYFPKSPAIGHHLTLGAGSQFPLTAEIRGIAGDAREEGLNSEPVPTVYWCYSAPKKPTGSSLRGRVRSGILPTLLSRWGCSTARRQIC